MKKLTFLLLCVLCTLSLQAQKQFTLASPDGNLKTTITIGDRLTYDITCNGRQILTPSPISMTLDNGTVWGENAKLSGTSRKSVDEMIPSPFYRASELRNHYNGLTLRFKKDWNVEFRAYNDGIAYRFVNQGKKPFHVVTEVSDYCFPSDMTASVPYVKSGKDGDYNSQFFNSFENTYTTDKLSKLNKQRLMFLPLVVDAGDGVKVCITESDLENYPGLYLSASEGANRLSSMHAPYPKRTVQGGHNQLQMLVKEHEDYIAKVDKPRNFPWRIAVVTTTDKDLAATNLSYLLGAPSRMSDLSWIKPGKVAWDWWNDWNLKGVPFKAGINMDTYKYYIDFASRNGLEYVVLDEGWYDPKSGDMLTVIPELDLPELIRYGKSKGVELVLWTVFNVLDSQLDEACRKYAEMGIKGFKVDFLDRDDQTAVEMIYRIAAKAAEYKLILDYHGIYKPTGLNRTYPNVVNYESVFGMEEMKWSEVEKNMPLYDVTFPYIRLMAGYVDYTPGAMRNLSKRDFQPMYSSPASMGTRCHQLAAYIVHDSPFTMLCDAPTNYLKEQECVDFISSIPVETDSTFIYSGKLGESIVTVRKKDINWYIGGMTNWDEREVTLDFSFLGEGEKYQCTLFKDGVNASRQAEDYVKETFVVDAYTKLPIHLASGGGFALKLERTFVTEVKPSAVPAGKGIPSFYKKYLEVDGLYIVSSDKVRDEALEKAYEIVSLMLAKRPDIKRHMVSKGCHVMIIGEHEEVCDLPEYAHICNTPENIAFWNKRARGFGGAPEDDFSASCGEENVLAFPGDKYVGENILIHEFAHLFHTIGIVGVEPDFDDRLEKCRQNAIAKGLWKDTYAISNKEEYFAECVQSFFNCNRYSETPNKVHNAMNRRTKLKSYDPDMYQLLKEYFYEIEIPILNEVHP